MFNARVFMFDARVFDARVFDARVFDARVRVYFVWNFVVSDCFVFGFLVFESFRVWLSSVSVLLVCVCLIRLRNNSFNRMMISFCI